MKSRRAVCASATVLAAFFTENRNALALPRAPLPLTLQTSGGVDCPSPEEFRAMFVTNRVGDPFAPNPPPPHASAAIVGVRVQITPTAGGFVLTVVYPDANGGDAVDPGETLTRERCRDLAHVAVSQITDALALERLPDPSPSPSPATPPPATSPVPVITPPLAPSPALWSGGLLAGGVLSLGTAPALSPGGFVGLTVSRAWFRAELEARVESEVRGHGDEVGDFTVARQSGAAALCARRTMLGARRATLGACALGRAGRIAMQQPSGTTAAELFVELGARGFWEFPLRPSVSLRAQLELTAPLPGVDLGLPARSPTDAQPWRSAWRSPIVSGSLGLGVFVQLW